MKISERLKLVYENLVVGEDVWDFCCDHGYLGGAAYKSRQFGDIYFVDQISSIIQKVKTRFETYVYQKDHPSTAHFILQSGQNVDRKITGTACITGVGALVINDILSGLANNQNLQAKRLILGPHRDVEKLLLMIQNNKNLVGYQLSSKKEVLENSRNRIFYIFDRVLELQ